MYNGKLVQYGTSEVIRGEKVFSVSRENPRQQKREEPEWGGVSHLPPIEDVKKHHLQLTLQIYLRLLLSSRQKISWLFVGGAQI